MRVQAEPTEHCLVVDGVEVRIWQAVTAQGAQVLLFVYRVVTDERGAPELRQWLLPMGPAKEIINPG